MTYCWKFELLLWTDYRCLSTIFFVICTLYYEINLLYHLVLLFKIIYLDLRFSKDHFSRRPNYYRQIATFGYVTSNILHQFNPYYFLYTIWAQVWMFSLYIWPDVNFFFVFSFLFFLFVCLCIWKRGTWCNLRIFTWISAEWYNIILFIYVYARSQKTKTTKNKNLITENAHSTNTVNLVGVLMAACGGVFTVFTTVALCYRSVVVHKSFSHCLIRLVCDYRNLYKKDSSSCTYTEFFHY